MNSLLRATDRALAAIRFGASSLLLAGNLHIVDTTKRNFRSTYIHSLNSFCVFFSCSSFVLCWILSVGEFNASRWWSHTFCIMSVACINYARWTVPRYSKIFYFFTVECICATILCSVCGDATQDAPCRSGDFRLHVFYLLLIY